MMPRLATKGCAVCGAPVISAGLWGLCAKCLYIQVSDARPTQALTGGARPRFGDYELGDVLGRGGMGVVYSATQMSLGRTVALKMILDSEAASPLLLRRFTVEAEAAAKLDHPNIVPIFEVGQHEGQPFLSMKLILGEDLRKKIAAGEFCLAPRSHQSGELAFRERSIAIVRLATTVARAVHHAHESGVLHRDLKPANILVDQDGQPHLTDFGLAKIVEAASTEQGPLTVSGTALGTPAYMSPEQTTGNRLTACSDIYSLGAILYEMLTGQPPFQAGSVLEVLRLVAEQEARPPRYVDARIDRDLDTICLKCLEKNPAARYPTAAALANDLDRWLRQEPIHARPAGVLLRSRRWIRRNPVGTALIGSLCIGLAGTLVLLQLLWARQRQLDLHSANTLLRFSRDVEETWEDAERQFVPIRSPELAELASLPPRHMDALALHLTFGITINEEPFGQAKQYAPFLAALEQRMELEIKRPVLIDLRLYKSETNAIRDAARGQLDFQRMGPLVYVLAKQANAELQPIAREVTQKDAVIFANKDSGVTNLAMVAGHRVAFGQRTSIISFWAKVHLARAGVHATNLQSWIHLSGSRQSRGTDPSRPIGAEDRDSETQAQKQVLQQVATGRADIGEAPRRNFELNRYRRHGLVPLLTYRVASDVYVARPGLDLEVVNALRKSLAAMRQGSDQRAVSQLSHNNIVQGFEPASDEEFDDIRSAMIREVTAFENGSISQESFP